mmetsp:Transcript_13835/g.60416  ORF Transcript_13835/g.60416 Transcript_13835/m.60416 type:complete len:349 (-) Transcript_13835:19-1065(-)
MSLLGVGDVFGQSFRDFCNLRLRVRVDLFADERERGAPRGQPTHLPLLHPKPSRGDRVLVAGVRTPVVFGRRAALSEDVQRVLAIVSVSAGCADAPPRAASFGAAPLGNVPARGAQQHPGTSRAHVPEPPVHAGEVTAVQRGSRGEVVVFAVDVMAVAGVTLLAEHRGGGAALGVDEVEADAPSAVGEAELILREVDPLAAARRGRVHARAPALAPDRAPVVVVRPAALGGGAPARLHRLSRDALRDDAVEPRHQLPLRLRGESPVVREVPRVAVVVRGLRARRRAGGGRGTDSPERLPSPGVSPDEVVPMARAGLDLAEGHEVGVEVLRGALLGVHRARVTSRRVRG